MRGDASASSDVFWVFNRLLDGQSAQNFRLTPHTHRSVRSGPITRTCPLCHERREARLRYLDRIGYSRQVCLLFDCLKGQEIRYRCFADGPWGYGYVRDFEYPNCCLDIQPVDWYGGDIRHGKAHWLRFGWCGVLYDESRFEFPARVPKTS